MGVLEDVNFYVNKNEFVVILGPSGCGKTTLLRLIAGLLNPTDGLISFAGKPVKGPDKSRGMMSQSYTCFPWLTVKKNIEFGLKINGVPLPQRNKVCDYYLNRIGLERFGDFYPKDLSGGMQQRVALARTLANEPEILLLDEPFSALDYETKWVIRELLLEIWADLEAAVLFVTHDVEEAVFLADRIYVSTKRPGTLLYELEVPFERPRPREIRMSAEFLRIVSEVLGELV